MLLGGQRGLGLTTLIKSLKDVLQSEYTIMANSFLAAKKNKKSRYMLPYLIMVRAYEFSVKIMCNYDKHFFVKFIFFIMMYFQIIV